MKRILSVLLVACLPQGAMAISPLSAEQSAALQAGLSTTADAFILPSYTAQAEAAADMTEALERYCSSQGALDAAQEGFAATFLAWQRASLVQVGPIMDAEGPMRVQLWPDPKGFSQRAVRAAIQDEADALLEPNGLTGRSIALTNLTALEYLLYGDLPPQSYACDLAVAIAAFQRDLADSLVRAWRPSGTYRALYDSAAQGNARYADVDALIRQFLAGGVVYADRLRKFKLLRGIGTERGAARAERTEARRSGLGRRSIEVSLRALSDLYDVPLGLFDSAADIGGSMEYFVLADTARSMADGLTVMTQSLDDIAAEDGGEAAELRRYADLILFHESFLKTGFTAAIGLNAGFTAADGD